MQMTMPSKDKIFKVGHGEPVLVINGGPGLSKSYILEGLSFIQSSRTCVFYDQPGCGADRTPLELISADTTAEGLIRLIRAILDTYKISRLDVISHSWGAHVLLRALGSTPDVRSSLGVILLLNPTATNAKMHNEAGIDLSRRLPVDSLKRIEELVKVGDEGAGRQIMDIAMPAYTGSIKRKPTMFFEYSIATYSAVAATLGDFDFADTVRAVADRLSVILGADDYLNKSHIGDLMNAARNVTVLKGVGHFPFAENPPAFRAALHNLFSE